MDLEEIEKIFIGTWRGTDNGSYIPGEINSWIVNRKSDGTLKIKYTTLNHLGEVDENTEYGTWWIEPDNIYMEIKEESEMYDVYHFNIISPNTIHFIDTSEEDNFPYNFLDHRVFLD